MVVVGAGLAGGLPAAAYLQRAGARVALVERGIDAGRFYLSYELFPGVPFDHSPVNFSALSPVVDDLELTSFGYELRGTEIAYSTLDRTGRALSVFADPESTVASIAVHSARDADAWARMMHGVSEHARELLRLVFYTPHPDGARFDEAVEITSQALDLPGDELRTLNAPALVERLFEDDFVRRSMMALPALNLFGDLLVPGQGALSWCWALMIRAAVAPAGNQSLVKALERAFVAAGGSLLRDATAVELEVRGGECRGVSIERHGRREALRARHAVVSNVGARHTHDLLTAGDCDLAGTDQSDFLGELARWETRGRVLVVQDLILRRRVPWPSAAEALGRSPRVYLLWDNFTESAGWLERSRRENEELFFDDVEITQFDVLYPERVREYVPLRIRFGTGPYLFGDEASDWDLARERMATRMHSLLAEYGLPVSESVVHEHVATPLDFWRSNPASRHGNPVGGDLREGQWIHDRLPYRTPIGNLYLSNSVWPPGLSLMAPGYNTACVVAEDMGIRDRDWWRHDPGGSLAAREPATVKGAA